MKKTQNKAQAEKVDRVEKPGKSWIKPHVTAAGAGAIAGEIAGAVVGSVAGPVGTIAGMVIGAAAGAIAGEELGAESERAHQHDEKLDQDIGVIGGDLGAVQPGGPPRRGSPSPASLGLSRGGGSAPSEGPMQDIDDDD
jgi:outer membrane lipoprotein SlyB